MPVTRLWPSGPNRLRSHWMFLVALVLFLTGAGAGPLTAAAIGGSGEEISALSASLSWVFFGARGHSSNSSSTATPDANAAAGNASSRAALRSQLDVLLDSVEAHYGGLLRRAHELHQPGAAALLQDLLLLQPTTFRKLAAVADAADSSTTAGGSSTADGSSTTGGGSNILQGSGGAAAGVAGVGLAAVAGAEGPRALQLGAGGRHAAHTRHQRRWQRRRLTATAEPGGAAAPELEPEPTYEVPPPLPSRLSTTASPPSLASWAARVGPRLAALPPALSYPVLRRLLAAVVARAWLDGGGEPLAAEEAAAVRELFSTLYSLHRQGAAHRGMMDYQHVSKSGGTSWCHAAQLNGCTTQRFDKYHVCGIKAFEDKVRWIDGAAHQRLTGGEPTRWSLHGTKRTADAPGCAGRAALMRANGWTYYSNEYTLNGGAESLADVELCSRQFVTAILFRNPLKRLASHLRFVLLHYSRFMAAQGTTGADFFKTYANANASFWHGVAPAITDNYFARTLLGEAAWHAPVGGLTTERELPAARLNLLQYDIVVPLEVPEQQSKRLMGFGAGWPASFTDVHDKNIAALQEQFSFDPVPYLPTESDMQHLYGGQEIDVRLYELAVLIGQLDYLVFTEAAAAGAVPWKGMPSQPPADDGPGAGDSVECGMLRGPEGVWSGSLPQHRSRRLPANRREQPT